MTLFKKASSAGQPIYWVVAGILLGLTGLGLGLVMTGEMKASPMVWGLLGASIGGSVGLTALVRHVFTRRATHGSI